MIAAEDIVTNDPKIVLADVGELWTAGDFSNRPHLRSGGLETLVDLVVSLFRQFHAEDFQSNIFCVWNAFAGNQKVRAFEGSFLAVVDQSEMN